ncbi:hypothetical protein Tco_1285059 [Tanacetum coccineum]
MEMTNQTNDRFKKDNGNHVDPHPLTVNYTYWPPLAESSTTQTSNTSVEMPRVESVRPSGVIIEVWVSDDVDIFNLSKIASNRQTVDLKDYYSQMAKKSVLKNMGKNTGQREIRPVWNSIQTINHENKFVPSAVLTRQTAVSTVKGTGVTAVKASAVIEMVKIYTDNNVADLLTKAFDGRLMVYKCSGLYTSAIWIEVGRWQSQAPRHHGGSPAHTRSERVLEKPNEPPLLEGHTSGSGEGMMEHKFELTANVLDLKKKKDVQAVEILRQKKRVNRLARQRKSSTSQPRRRKYIQVKSSDDDLNEEDASK